MPEKLSCYLCDSRDAATCDHVPPTGFFPDPRPNNLITVPCCARCNDSYKLDDEAFRAWITAPPTLSPAGKWIQKNKVFENTFKNSPKLVEHARNSMREVDFRGQTIDMIDFPRARADRFLIRVTKGLLAHFYPTFDRSSQMYKIHHLTHATTGWEQLEKLRDAANYDERGEGVFQFRHRVSLELNRGYWMFTFYEASLFLVWHHNSNESPNVSSEQVTS